MRYRALTSDGDSTFGSGATTFFVDNRSAVAQAVQTRLGLMTGEWFLNLGEGTPYLSKIIGHNTGATYDRAVRDRILGTIGVLSITTYNSSLDRATRKLTVDATIDTIFGQTTVQAVVLLPPITN